MSHDVAIIGGGVSGLATAFGLMQRGYRVAVLERQARPGGSAVSERIGGFLMEHGPSSVNAGSVEAAVLSRALGLDAGRCELGDDVRYRYLVSGDGLARLGTGPFSLLASSYLSPRARLRLAAEPFIPRAPENAPDETVAAFWTRRFGPEFAARVIDPLVGGLFAGLAEETSMRAVFPKLAAMERARGSVTRAMLAHRLRGRRMPGRRLYSWREGVGSLPRALAARLGPALRTGIAVRRIRATGAGFRIEAGAAGALDARAVVLATQPHVAAELLEPLDAEAAGAVGGIAAPPLAVVFLGYRRGQVAHPLDGVGFLAPRGEGRGLTGAQFCSTMFPGRAEAGHVTIAAYVGGARAPDLARLPTADLVALAREALGELLGARGAPTVARVRQWPLGLPQYAPGHDRRIAALDAAARARPGLFLAGNYFRGPSIAACLAQAEETGARVHDFLAAGVGSTEDVPLAASVLRHLS